MTEVLSVGPQKTRQGSKGPTEFITVSYNAVLTWLNKEVIRMWTLLCCANSFPTIFIQFQL